MSPPDAPGAAPKGRPTSKNGSYTGQPEGTSRNPQGRGPNPHDLGAERVVLGHAVTHGPKALRGEVVERDFYSPQNAATFAAILELDAAGASIDAYSVAPRVDGLTPELVSEWQATGDGFSAGPSAARVVAEYARKRVALSISHDLADAANNGAPIHEAAARAADRLEALTSGRAGVALRSLRLADVAPERVEWVWRGRIPAGKLTTVDGNPGDGKSTLTGADLAARVSTGSPMPDGSEGVGPADVLIFSAEDGVADTIRPRLNAAGGDPDRVHVLVEVSDPGSPDGVRPPSIPRDLGLIEAKILETGAVLVVVDVLNAFLGSGVDSYRDQDVRRALHPLAAMAERTGAAVLAIRHLNKGAGLSALYRGGGSIGIVGAARCGLIVGTDPEDETRRVLAVTKSNLAAKPRAMAYRLVPDEEHGCAKVQWEGETTYQADDLVATPPEEDDLDATAALESLLEKGPMLVKDVYKEMDAAGFSKDQAKRAKKRLRVRSTKTGGSGEPWQWELPGPKGGKEGEQEKVAPSAPLPPLDDAVTTQVDAGGAG